MLVKFKFDYILNLHDRQLYTNAINKNIDEEIAFNKSIVQLNRCDIKSINKSTDNSANIIMKNGRTLTTVEDYDYVIGVSQKADAVLDIIHKEKVYIFDDFVVDEVELDTCIMNLGV